MPLYRLQEADLDIPDRWQDQSINIFKLPAVGTAREASFVISRDPGRAIRRSTTTWPRNWQAPSSSYPDST